MKKSEISREDYKGSRRVCRGDTMKEGKCHDKATAVLTIVTHLTEPVETLTSTSLLCARHADATVAAYENEWAKHPEMFCD